MGGAAPQAMPLRIFQGTPAKCIGYFLTDPKGSVKKNFAELALSFAPDLVAND